MYKQSKGTGMGTSNGCEYADTAMNALDEKVHDENNGPAVKPVLFARFRDDIYVPWTECREKLDSFLLWLNEFHPNITFTMSNPSTEGTTFLETYIYMEMANFAPNPISNPVTAMPSLFPHHAIPPIP